MRLFISAGEPSGDLHGSNLIRALQQQHADLRAAGFGSRNMAETGCHLLADMDKLAIMGFARIVPHLKKFWDLLEQADTYFRETRPDAVVLIDYPGFNWWIARRAKRHSIPVFYYGTPQIWGWATHRVRKLRKLVDHALCKLPFEPAWYRERGCVATYVGHPYFDDFLNRDLDHSFLHDLGEEKLVAILPGSRRHEVQKNLPAFLKTARVVQRRLPGTKFAVASYGQQQADMAMEMISKHRLDDPPKVYVDRTRELIHKATCCIACSGSVSLELLHEATPTVIHYKIDPLGDFLQKRFRRCKFITLVNLLTSDRRFHSEDAYDPNDVGQLSEAPFPEYLTYKDRSEDMAQHLIRWVSNDAARQASIDSLGPLQREFVKPGASKRAAAYILHELKQTRRSQAHLPASAKVA